MLRFQPVVDGSTLKIDAPLPDTPLGREDAREVRSGRRPNLSIECHPTDVTRVVALAAGIPPAQV